MSTDPPQKLQQLGLAIRRNVPRGVSLPRGVQASFRARTACPALRGPSHDKFITSPGTLEHQGRLV